ncbi:M1 family metallopeptidase [Mucilaginibacter litoreus]|uniref:Aminopeptidase N n=1 Tax=Mucilaginibacter litoreus TaxID=1048221 RepID=A0ABW3AX72_9SPHI
MRRNILFTALLALTNIVSAQQLPSTIDVQHYRFAITLTDATNVIKGEATVTAKATNAIPAINLDLIKKRADGKGMTVLAVTENGKALKFSQDSSKLTINTQADAGSVHNYKIAYEGIPADGLIISTNRYNHRTFFGDNWATRAKNWLPCVDDPADKASVEFIVTAPAKYTVVANGLKVSENVSGDNKVSYWKETALLPTKVMVIGVAEFAVEQSGQPDGIPISTYVFPEDKEVGFKSYAVAAKIVPWFSKRIGAFPYKKLANVQSKTIFGGMENAGAIFYFEQSVKDRGIEALMAHEIAHQWFGDAISEKNWWHVWLSEGFATYMTNLYIEGQYGTDSLNKRLDEDRKAIFGFEKKYKAPVVDSAFHGQMMELLNTNAYQKGGWVLHMLRRKIGDDAFWKGIAAYYKKYNGGNATTSDLCNIMEKASGQQLKQFFTQWLRTSGHPQLDIRWQYSPSAKQTTLTVKQLQPEQYKFNLEYSVDGKTYQKEINDGMVVITVPSSATPDLKIDPNINLLAQYNVTQEKD